MKRLLKDIFSWKMIKAIGDLIFRYLPAYLYVLLFHKKEQCWLITERPTDARDNGYVLFKWLCENHPEKRVVYAIHKDAPDYANVKDLGNVIEYGSWMHWYYYFASSICCDTSWGICSPNSMTFLIMRNILPPKSKRVFLQHGITKDYMPQGRKHKLKADIFVCGAYPEWEYISQHFGYNNGEVRYIGFARFDNLRDTSVKRQILFMPTWRAGLHHISDFQSTLYYMRLSSILSSMELNNYLVEADTELIYFIHPSIRDKKKFFEPFANSHIRILNNEDYDLQKLICSAKMLITDFSSIYFDFAYQGKPVIYYHFDYDEYRKIHYAEGYFSYEHDGFGPIVKSEEELLMALKSITDNNWHIPVEYEERAKRFFPIRDRNNCQRHYDALCELEISSFQ